MLIADSVGLGKTWIGKKLLEDFAYHRRQKAVVVCPASLRPMWRRELSSATIAAQVVGMEELGRDGFDTAPYKLESYRKKSAIRDEKEHEWEAGRETALVGIFKTRFLKRLESSIAAFRESLRRALVFEETYLEYLLGGTVVSSRD